MIVITLTKVPKSLRGDLTKWCQEVDTGVYVGNFSARIREMLWDRITKNVGLGDATMVYNMNNEIGYQFKTTRSDKKVVDYDGIPLIMNLKTINNTDKHGFSKAYKYHQAKKFNKTSKEKHNHTIKKSIVAIDLETTGLNPEKDNILSIGAQKLENGKSSSFYRLIKTNKNISKKITKVTKIDNDLLSKKGVPVVSALNDLKDFINDCLVVGYNLQFDLSFLNREYQKLNQNLFTNSTKDLLPVVKQVNKFLDNYKLESVLDKFDIYNPDPHNSLSDAKATLKLACKLIENDKLSI